MRASLIYTTIIKEDTTYSILKQVLPIILLREIKCVWNGVIKEFSNTSDIFSFRSNNLDLFTKNATSSLGGFTQMLNNYCFPDT